MKCQCHQVRRKVFKGLENSDFKSGLAVVSGDAKSGKINITKTCKNFGPKKLGCRIQNVMKSGDEKAIDHCIHHLTGSKNLSHELSTEGEWFISYFEKKMVLMDKKK